MMHIRERVHVASIAIVLGRGHRVKMGMAWR